MTDPAISIEDTQYVFLATLIILVLEALTGQLKGASRRDFGLTAVCFVANSAVMRPLVGLGVGVLAVQLVPQYAGGLSHLPLWQAFLGIFVAMEFVFYWVHRWSHEGQKKGSRLSWLWKIHRTHHSATQINVSVTIRQNIFWAFFTPHTWMTGLSIYLGMEAGVALALLSMYIWNLFTHMHWRTDDAFLRSKPFRALQHVIVTPSMHHAHHGYGKNGKMYRNYALCLSVFDWMFGTLYLPDGKPSRYGVPGETPHWTEEAFYPLTSLAPKRAPAESTPS